MNEYIFYTTEGYTYPPKEDMEIENCQVLGRAYGETAKEAKVNLLQRCPWIQESGFDIEEIICSSYGRNGTAFLLNQRSYGNYGSIRLICQKGNKSYPVS